MNCTPKSIVVACLEAAQLGLEIGKALGHAYLVPRGGVCVLQKGYKGILELLRRSGEVNQIYARIRYEKDEWSYTAGDDERLVHVPFDGEDAGPMVAVYAICRMSNGTVYREIMWKSEIDRIRDRFGSKRGPWETDYSEMAKKTVILRLCKVLPLSPATHEALYEDVEVKAPVPVIPVPAPVQNDFQDILPEEVEAMVENEKKEEAK